MDASLLELEEEASSFFLRDTGRRLSRMVEMSLGYSGFVLLLYCRLLCPGGLPLWRWLESEVLWVFVFAPLFLLDWRSLLHWKYLRANRSRFPPHESRRFLLMCLSEITYKFLLCAHLACGPLRDVLTVKVAMFPYAVGYVLHFIIGHFVPLDDAERPEGCNVVAALLSDLGRFLSFVLVVSLSLKVDSSSSVVYDWKAAFWPCWGLEGIIILVVVLLLPVCLISAVVDRAKMLMLSWVVVFGVGLGVVSFISMYNIAVVLDNALCPDIPDLESSGCQSRLALALCPWLVFFPAFALATTVARHRLAQALHDAWYQPVRATADDDAGRAPHPVPAGAIPEGLPSPLVMFRVTATYYSRTTEAAWPEGDFAVAEASVGPLESTSSFVSPSSRRHRALDPSASILSARGALYADIVESEQLCFVCYDQPPDAVLLECGHAGLCQMCAVHLLERRQGQAQCPICRNGISHVVRIRADLPLPRGLFVERPPTPHRPPTPGSCLPAPSTPPAAAAVERERGGLAASSGALLPPRAPATSRGTIGASWEEAAGLGTGPPWPRTARQHAVVVEVVHSLPRAGVRWWRPPTLP